MATVHGLSRRTFLRLGLIGFGGIGLLAACAPQPPAAKPADAPAPAATPPSSAGYASSGGGATYGRTSGEPAEAAKPAADAKPAAPPAAAKPAEAAKPAAERRREARPQHDRQAGRPDDPGGRPAPAKARGGADAGRAGQGRQAATGRAAHPATSRWSSSRSTRSASTAAPGVEPSPAWPTRRTATGSSPATSCCSWTTPATRSSRAWRSRGRSGTAAETFVFNLRKGMKWSDGQPFTADDIMFWYEDIYQNKDLVPIPTYEFTINGKPGTIEKIDDLTVAFKFPEPYFLFEEMIAGDTPSGTATRRAARR